MPTLINGMGSSYFGRRDARVRQDVCEFCGKKVSLRSYETTKWFVLGFIPICPLGDKMILDMCPRCTGHRVLSLKEWDRVRDHGIEKINRSFDSGSATPRQAMEGLLVMAHFDTVLAMEMADKISQRFPDNDDLQLALGKWHRLQHRHSQANEHCERALELNPDNLCARRELGIACLGTGDLNRAEEFLSHIIADCKPADAPVLARLAEVYHQRDDNHDWERAMELYTIALKADSELDRDKDMRQRVQLLEQKLGLVRSSILTNRFNYARMAFWIFVFLLTLAVWWLWNKLGGFSQFPRSD